MQDLASLARKYLKDMNISCKMVFTGKMIAYYVFKHNNIVSQW